MMRRKWLLCSLLNIILLTNAAIVTKWKRRIEECRLKMEHVFEQRVIGSLHECLSKCNDMTDCESVSWFSNGNDCLFSSSNTVDDVRSEYVKWELEADWVTYSLVKYPVARIFKPDPVNVDMTFEEAVNACADHHVALASLDNLLLAVELGMARCACGWLSNGEIRMDIPSLDTCSKFPDVTGPAAVTCNDTEAIAWCKIN